MHITVEVSESSNCPMSLERVFDGKGEPRVIELVVAPNPKGDDETCRVTGWSSTGPCSVRAIVVEDSGEGVLMLIFGGDEGIRLQPMGRSEAWDLKNSNQWGEACLLLHRDVELA